MPTCKICQLGTVCTHGWMADRAWTTDYDSKEPFNPDVKKFPIPAVLKTTCKCGAEVDHDLEEFPREYQWFNTPIDVYFHCNVCENEWSVKVTFEISIK